MKFRHQNVGTLIDIKIVFSCLTLPSGLSLDVTTESEGNDFDKHIPPSNENRSNPRVTFCSLCDKCVSLVVIWVVGWRGRRGSNWTTRLI